MKEILLFLCCAVVIFGGVLITREIRGYEHPVHECTCKCHEPAGTIVKSLRFMPVDTTTIYFPKGIMGIYYNKDTDKMMVKDATGYHQFIITK